MPLEYATMLCLRSAATVPNRRGSIKPPAFVLHQRAIMRAASNGFIAAFLLYQIAMPLRYYARGGGYDERFSWRMFSTVRMQKCTVRVRETAKPDDGGEARERSVNLNHELQIAWIGMLERDRPQVVRKFLARRCQQPDVSAVR